MKDLLKAIIKEEIARAMIEDPVSGEMKLGFAVYYQDTLIDTVNPTGSSGNVGDLWVQY